MPILEKLLWKNDGKQRFSSWIQRELVNAQGDRAALDKKWSDAIVQWRAAMPKGDKDFPWPGASNLEFPLTAIHSDPVYADFMQSLHAPAEYWSVSAHRSDRVSHASPLTEAMKRVEARYIKMRTVNSRALLDNNILGTAIYKSHWINENKKVRDYSRGTPDRVVELRVKPRSHPIVEHVPLQHFWIPAYAWNIDPDAPIGGAQWVAQEIYLRGPELQLKAKGDGIYAPAYDAAAVATVLKWESEYEATVDSTIRKQEQLVPSHNRRIRLFEVWVRFDADGDDIEEDFVAIYHLESNTILRALYNPFLHGQRPFHRTRYLPTFGFYGLGLAEADEWAQHTASKLLNATIDNVMLANTRMYSAPLGGSVQPGEPIYPGKTWFVGPNEQIGEVRLGEVYPSIFNIQAQIMQLAEQRTGVSELRQGNMTGLPSRTPATTTLSLLREGNKRFDMIMSDFRETHSLIGSQVFSLLAQWFKEDEATWSTFYQTILGPEDAMKVAEVFMAPQETLEDEFGVGVTATSAQVNKEVEKQAFIGLMQILTQVYGSMVQTAQLLQTVPPGSPTYETAAAAYMSGTQLLARLLEKFDIQNPKEYLGNLEAIAGSLVAMGGGANAALAAPGGIMAPPMGGGAMAAPPGMLGQDQIGALLGF